MRNREMFAVLILILLTAGIAGSAQAMAKKPGYDAMGALTTLANTTCKSATSPKPQTQWTQTDYETYYACYYKPCLAIWNKAGWQTYDGACCATGVDCNKL